MHVLDLITDNAVGIDAIAAHLDGLSDAQRWIEVGRLPRHAQRVLFAKAAASAPMTFDDLVPSHVAALVPVHHRGWNTLPLPSVFRSFEKRFCRPADGSQRLFGYNEGRFRRVVGPGYFVAVPTDDNAYWRGISPVLVDYYQVPDGSVPASWPRVRPNTRGFQRFVYHGTRDFLRKVSAHVSIGGDYFGDRPVDHYFVLCRIP